VILAARRKSATSFPATDAVSPIGTTLLDDLIVG
jgi:hypothetical protein